MSEGASDSGEPPDNSDGGRPIDTDALVKELPGMTILRAMQLQTDRDRLTPAARDIFELYLSEKLSNFAAPAAQQTQRLTMRVEPGGAVHSMLQKMVARKFVDLRPPTQIITPNSVSSQARIGTPTLVHSGEALLSGSGQLTAEGTASFPAPSEHSTDLVEAQVIKSAPALKSVLGGPGARGFIGDTAAIFEVLKAVVQPSTPDAEQQLMVWAVLLFLALLAAQWAGTSDD